MNIIYKYPISIQDGTICIVMPKGAQIMCVKTQREYPYIWAMIALPINHENETRNFHWFGTGKPIEEFGNYIGTVQVNNETLVFHLFEDQDD